MLSKRSWIAAVVALVIAQAGAAQARKRVVVMVGLPGSGKTTLSKALSRTMKAPYFKCGDVVRGWIRAQGLPYTPQNDRRASQHFARTPGEIARQLSKTINKTPGKVHIVDGVRSPADMKVLRDNFDVRVVALKLPARIRHKRMLARGRFDGVDKDYLRGRDRREIGLGVLHLLRKPFTRVDMRGPLAQVPSQAKQLATQLKKSW